MYCAYALRPDGKVETRIWTKDPKEYQVVETVSREEHEREFFGIETRVFRDQEVLPVEYADVLVHAKDNDGDVVRQMWFTFLSTLASEARVRGRKYAGVCWQHNPRDNGAWPDSWLTDSVVHRMAENVLDRWLPAAKEDERKMMAYEVANGASNHWRFLKAKGDMGC